MFKNDKMVIISETSNTSLHLQLSVHAVYSCVVLLPNLL